MPQQKLVEEWSLPKGDVYEVWQTTGTGALSFHSMVRREKETTLCCHGTNSMMTIRQYYMDVKLAQQDIMDDTKNAQQHAYWISYKKRRLSPSGSHNSTSSNHAQTSSHPSLNMPKQTIASQHVSSKKVSGKKVSFLC
tara:strand:- start:371 stop:784 length:414 start_codon:yes stop_codon:yes gene_type:complete